MTQGRSASKQKGKNTIPVRGPAPKNDKGKLLKTTAVKQEEVWNVVVDSVSVAPAAERVDQTTRTQSSTSVPKAAWQHGMTLAERLKKIQEAENEPAKPVEVVVSISIR